MKGSECLHVVEPTLASAAGHCHSFVASLCAVVERPPLCLWVNRKATVDFAQAGVSVRRHFWRRIRRLQSYFLFRKLLRAPGRIFVSTAGRSDLALVDWVARAPVSPDKVFFFFHWFNATDRKMRALKRIADRQPNFVILAPTPTVIAAFKEAGFQNCHVVPYPVSVREQQDSGAPPPFTRLLYAGAARRDKGFSRVVDLIGFMAAQGLDIPVTIQASPEHFGKLDAATRADISRVQAIGYPHLTVQPDTLEPHAYRQLFVGAICLQLYSPTDFADRISGVTLDALSAGAPVVATAGTWIARMVERFQAGTVIGAPTPTDLLTAVQSLIDEYPKYSANARAGGQVLQRENSADALMRAIAG